MVMVKVMDPSQQINPEIRSLAAVILRRNISTTDLDSGDAQDSENNANLWQRLSDPCRDQVKGAILMVLQNCSDWPKNVVHKVCSLATEIQGAMHEKQENMIW